MIFRYDFGEKLDITKFNVQAKHYIGQMRQLKYWLTLQHYRLIIDIDTPDNSNAHLVSIGLISIVRDKDGEIKEETWIHPTRDVRFQDFKIVKEIWESNEILASFPSNSSSFTVDRVIVLLKVIHKINNLQVFL